MKLKKKQNAINIIHNSLTSNTNGNGYHGYISLNIIIIKYYFMKNM